MLPSFFNYVPDVQQVQNYLQQFTSADDRGPSSADLGAVSVDDNQFNKGLASLTGARAFSPMSDFPSYMTSPRAGTDTRDENLDATDPTMAALTRAVPALNASYNRAPFPVGGGTSRPDYNINNLEAGRPGMDDLLGDPLIYAQDRPIDRRPRPDPNEIANALTVPPYDINNLEAGRLGGSSGLGQSPGAMGGRYFPVKSGLTGVSDDPFAPPTRPGTDFFGEDTLGPLGSEGTAKLYEEIKQGRQPKNEKERTFFQKVVDFFTKGGPGGGAQLRPFTQDTSGRLFPVSGGPGPYVGGGVPSPSAEMGGGAPSPIQCPPGFKFDPVQNICVPIVAPAPPVTTPPAPGTTAPAPATGGISNIPNVYPFTLTPPIGAPIGNIAPVRS
jgi:hypothetical protein